MQNEKLLNAVSAPPLRINLTTMDETIDRLVEDAEKGRGFTVFTLNLDHLVKLRVNKLFQAAYGRARYVTADGWPIVWLGRWKGAALERTTGADLILPLCEQAARKGLPVYFFGSSEASLQAASDALQKRFPDLLIAGMKSPEYGFDPHGASATKAAEEIAQSGAKLCFVALGAPKQELFADRAHQDKAGIGYLCIGAALDFIAGHQSRAPVFMQKTGTEWLYRLASNPRRLFARYVSSAVLFGEIIFRHLLGQADDNLEFPMEEIKK